MKLRVDAHVLTQRKCVILTQQWLHLKLLDVFVNVVVRWKTKTPLRQVSDGVQSPSMLGPCNCSLDKHYYVTSVWIMTELFGFEKQ